MLFLSRCCSSFFTGVSGCLSKILFKFWHMHTDRCVCLRCLPVVVILPGNADAITLISLMVCGQATWKPQYLAFWEGLGMTVPLGKIWEWDLSHWGSLWMRASPLGRVWEWDQTHWGGSGIESKPIGESLKKEPTVAQWGRSRKRPDPLGDVWTRLGVSGNENKPTGEGSGMRPGQLGVGMRQDQPCGPSISTDVFIGEAWATHLPQTSLQYILVCVFWSCAASNLCNKWTCSDNYTHTCAFTLT